MRVDVRKPAIEGVDVLVGGMRIYVGVYLLHWWFCFNVMCIRAPVRKTHTPERAAVRDRAHSSQQDWIEMRPSGGDTSPPDREPPHV